MSDVQVLGLELLLSSALVLLGAIKWPRIKAVGNEARERKQQDDRRAL